ncbi:hypothetical protein [Oleiagrimonas sp. C23AA]|uniref:hypothetical protein n=1 Tax=Oleiagrimonas sp. C23AA TaxID=2719047 RepID=UPI001420BD1C|nr:hypothetical protein [Oleiagrimonas sp. C23AA]NII11233.1 hypothetical protein [Oleiagrimonas sp. C23AA]
MKLQMEAQHLRFRISEKELATLLDGGAVDNLTTLDEGHHIGQRVTLADSDHASLDTRPTPWQLRLPRTAVAAYARRLPTREGLHFHLPRAESAVLEIQFDVDVRDSARTRLSSSS